MDLTLTEDQELVRATARDLLAARAATAGAAAVAGEPAGHSAELWKEMVELGWTALALPEEHGGLGEGFFETCLLVEELGAAAVPSPFLVTVACCANAIARAGTGAQRARLLPPVAQGRTMTFAPADGGDPGGGGTVTATADGHGGHVLDGQARLVPFGGDADDVLVVAASGAGRSTAFVVEAAAPGLHRRPVDVVGPDPAHDLRFDGVAVRAEHLLGASGEGGVVSAAATAYGAAATCAAMVGGAQRVLDLTVAYAAERTQFGRPIGSFQAVQHHCADMAIDVLTARYLAYEAIWRLGAPERPHDEAALTVASAKAWVGEAYERVCARGHQVHGAIGFTAEHGLHHYLGHAEAAALAFGDAEQHLDRVADLIGLPPR